MENDDITLNELLDKLKRSPALTTGVISIALNVVLIIIFLSLVTTGDVPGYEKRSELEARATECTLEHVDPDVTTTAAEITESTEEETTTATTKATKKDNKKTTKKTTTTTKSNNDSYYGGGGGVAINTTTNAATTTTNSDYGFTDDINPF